MKRIATQSIDLLDVLRESLGLSKSSTENIVFQRLETVQHFIHALALWSLNSPQTDLHAARQLSQMSAPLREATSGLRGILFSDRIVDADPDIIHVLDEIVRWWIVDIQPRHSRRQHAQNACDAKLNR